MLQPHDPHSCPVDQALDLIAGKWKPMILWRLCQGRLRHSELRRAVSGVTQRMLTLHLRELERDGLVSRTVFADLPPRVEYALTPSARRLIPLLEAFGSWWLDTHADAGTRARAEQPAVSMPAAASNVRVFRIGR